jgi:hypothetical protein
MAINHFLIPNFFIAVQCASLDAKLANSDVCLLTRHSESPENLECGHFQATVIKDVSRVSLSQPDEAAFSRIRNSKRGRHRAVFEILVVCFPINLSPDLTVERTLKHQRFRQAHFDCAMSRADALFAEIPADPLPGLRP